MICVMESLEWRPVVEVNSDGLVLAIGADGRWMVGRDEASARPADEVLVWLLPLLERPWRQVVAVQPLTGVHAPPWDDVLRVALEWRTASGYWQSMALGWFEDGWPVERFVGLLGELKDAPGKPQSVRHRALRLWKAARV